MIKLTTNGVQITVETVFQAEYSSIKNGTFLFAYKIDICNYTDHRIQLLSRKWVIFDSTESNRIVEGEGVVGEQPIIEPGDTYSYVSACNLNSEIGNMQGMYRMLRLDDQRIFEVQIPRFHLIAPYRLN